MHKGQRGVTMATNFGSKIAINAYKCISVRDIENVITSNRGFSWSTNRGFSWLRGPAVEHWSLADVLSLSCARLVAVG